MGQRHAPARDAEEREDIDDGEEHQQRREEQRGDQRRGERATRRGDGKRFNRLCGGISRQRRPPQPQAEMILV